MRWGVRDENTLDHRTWIECQRELERCRIESNDLFFLSLQSEKYGYTPLPLKIEKISLESKLILDGSTLDDDRVLCREWYHLDENALPSSYFLRKLAVMNDDSYWKNALPRLTALLEGLPFEYISTAGDGLRASSTFQPEAELKINHSVTEWEVRTAINGEPEQQQMDSSTRLC